MKYFQSSEDSESSGFLSCLTKLENLKLLTFVADVLSVFSRYQKKLQSDSVTILDIDRASDHLKKKIAAIEETPLLGGWVAAINDKFVQQENGELSLKEVMLLKPRGLTLSAASSGKGAPSLRK